MRSILQILLFSCASVVLGKISYNSDLQLLSIEKNKSQVQSTSGNLTLLNLTFCIIQPHLIIPTTAQNFVCIIMEFWDVGLGQLVRFMDE